MSPFDTPEFEPDLWQRVTSQDALRRAWEKVVANRGSAGGDGVNLGAFRADLFANLMQLRAELLGGTYRTGPFRKVSIPKKKPGYRILTIPSIRDRVVHTAIATALNPILEAVFEECSFAYRPNRGVVHAVQRIEHWRKRGYDTVIEADIVSYFDNVDQEVLQDKLTDVISPLPGSAPLLALIAKILTDQAKALGTPGQGLVQGSPLSPLLANLYLDALDEEIESQGVKLIRFADDFVILCKSERKARKVLQHCVNILGEHNLRLHEEGTRIVNFEQGFDFIGYLFVRTLALKEKTDPSLKANKPVKSSITDEGIIELDDAGSRYDPGKRVLYLLDAEHRLDIRNRSFSVRRDEGAELIAIPYKRVGRIEIGPRVAFSHACIHLALEANVDVSLVDGFGQTKGYLHHAKSSRAGLQFAQAAAILRGPFRLEIARKISTARIRNQRTQLMRLNRSKRLSSVTGALASMRRSFPKLETANTVEQIRGLEGSTTAKYWLALGALLDKATNVPFKRSRPARDAINAVINYMTGILERDVRAAVTSVGLHTGFAFLHSARDRHDGLVFDLMEPYRAPITEGLAVYLFNARRLRYDMFVEEGDSAVQILPEGRKAIIDNYEYAVAKRVNKSDGSGKLAWRPMMRFEAQTLARAVVEEDSDLFTPYLMEA